MKRKLLTLALAVTFVMQYGASVTYAQPGPALLDPRDGMYLTRIINLTGEQLSIDVTNDTSNSDFKNKYPKLYSTDFPVSSSNPLNNQQNIATPTPIQLDTLIKHNPKKKYEIPKGSASWEGMINLTPLIPASNENNSYITYSGHFSQGQRLTITTVNNKDSILNNAYIQFGYVYSSPKKILWGNVFDFAASTIKNAAQIAIACEDGNVKDGLEATASEIKDIVEAFKTNPVSPSLNSAATLSQEPVTTETSKFTKQVTKNYAQVMALFSGDGGGSCITDSTKNNQIYIQESTKQKVLTLTASDNTVKYFTAPAYYIYIKNVQAPNVGDVNECTIAIVDGWLYNLAVGVHHAEQQNSQNLQKLQKLNPLQLMYYAGSTTSPNASTLTNSVEPAVNIIADYQNPVTIISATVSYIGG